MICSSFFGEALPLHGESRGYHGYQENLPPAWIDSRGKGQPELRRHKDIAADELI
jgi:hypothetical protein